MGLIRNVQTGQTFHLFHRTQIGRSRQNDLMIAETWVSGEHAVISFSARQWSIRDLNSSNGTTLDGQPLPPRIGRPLKLGARLAFGQAEETWAFEEDSPPTAMAVGPHGVCQSARDGVLVLPDERHHWATITLEDERWVLTDTTSSRQVADGDIIVLQGDPWTLRLPDPIAPTRETGQAPVALEDIHLLIRVSRDEETVDVRLSHARAELDLAQRAHHELLLHLARASLRDRDEGHAEAECGWRYSEDVARALDLPVTHLNVNVGRLRNQIAEAGVLDAKDIVERRPRAGQLRLAPIRVAVERLGAAGEG